MTRHQEEKMTRPRQKTKFSRFEALGNLELLHAAYTRQTFSPHFHEGHVMGTIEQGALGFDYRGEKLVAAPGQINLADPGEVHNGFAVSKRGWQYRMFYLAPGQLESIVTEICEHKTDMPFFKTGVIQDAGLARVMQMLHRDFSNPEVSLLEKESRFYSLVLEMVRRHTRVRLNLPSPGREDPGMARVKAYIHAHHHRNVSLCDLAETAALSKYHMLRVFKLCTGMTPHAYLNLVRASAAKQMMPHGRPLAQIALDAGFFDQSHLNRIFKKVYGITPGQYIRAAV